MRKFVKFGITGGMGVIWKTIFLLFFVEILKIDENIAVFPTAVIVLMHNYEINRYWTYKNVFPRSWYSFKLYAAANTLSLGLYFASYFTLNFFMEYIIASIVSVGIAGFLNFILANKIFRVRQEV